jgi:hypothetical protein
MGARKGRPYVAARSCRTNKQKPEAVSHPGEIGAIPEFQFLEWTDLNGRVKRTIRRASLTRNI